MQVRGDLHGLASTVQRTRGVGVHFLWPGVVDAEIDCPPTTSAP
jgi:hypothetical protein